MAQIFTQRSKTENNQTPRRAGLTSSEFLCGESSKNQQNLNNELQSIFRIIFRRCSDSFLCYIFYIFQSHFNDLNLLSDSFDSKLIINFLRFIFKF